MRVVAYVRVSTESQASNGHGLEAQRDAITRSGHEVVAWIEETKSAGLGFRPGLDEAVTLIRQHHAEGLVVAKLDRLTRSVKQLHELLERAQREGWALVALDLNVDTSTPHGKLLTSIIGAIAEWERDIISQRTREGLEAAKARGVRLGRPSFYGSALVSWIRAQRAIGLQYQAICDMLNEQDVPTRTGKPWTRQMVWRVVTVKQYADD